MEQNNYTYQKIPGFSIQISVVPDPITIDTSPSPLLSHPSGGDELLNIKEAVSIALRSASTLDRLRKSGQLAYTKIGRNVFFKRADLLAIRKEVRLRGLN